MNKLVMIKLDDYGLTCICELVTDIGFDDNFVLDYDDKCIYVLNKEVNRYINMFKEEQVSYELFYI